MEKKRKKKRKKNGKKNEKKWEKKWGKSEKKMEKKYGNCWKFGGKYLAGVSQKIVKKSLQRRGGFSQFFFLGRGWANPRGRSSRWRGAWSKHENGWANISGCVEGCGRRWARSRRDGQDMWEWQFASASSHANAELSPIANATKETTANNKYARCVGSFLSSFHASETVAAPSL